MSGFETIGPFSADLIDSEKITGLFENFYSATGFPTALLDLKGNVIARSPYRRICEDFHKKNSSTAEKC